MSLITGENLNPNTYFSSGNAKARGSSFDLTIGRIIGVDGEDATEPFVLKPGHMVQVVSAETFKLPANVTGHVTYKTGLTKQGIWALTVGIVDPGWDKPITTTLLNFSKREYAVCSGDAFLRVSLFDHSPVQVGSNIVADYMQDVKKAAKLYFPATFLDQDEIAKKAGTALLNDIRNKALAWVGLVALSLTLASLLGSVVQFTMNGWYRGALFHSTDFDHLEDKVTDLQDRVRVLEAKGVKEAQTDQISPKQIYMSGTSTSQQKAKLPRP